MSILKIAYNKKEYDLEYSRESVRLMESQDFSLEELTKKPETNIPKLFYGAFLKNHRGIKRNLVEEIFEHLTGKSDLITALAEMYSETVNTLMEDAEPDEGNATWVRIQ